jgi:hypothetical protein
VGNNKLFLAVALFAAACQNGKDSKSSEESKTTINIGVEMSEVDSLSLLESPAIPQRGMITCVDNRFPFIQVAFVDSVATLIRDRSDTLLGNLDSCTLKLTEFTVDGASYELAGLATVGIDLFEHRVGGNVVASKLVRSGILLGLADKADCTTLGQDCTSYSANFVYSQIDSSNKSISNDLRVNQLSMTMEAEQAASCNVSAKWLEHANLGGSPNLEIKLTSCSALGGLPIQYGLNIKTGSTQSASNIEAAHAIISSGQVRGSFSGSSQTIVLSLEEVQALNPGSSIFQALQADFELAIRGVGAISVSVYTLD